jgi:type VI protein secretion system component VasK
MVAHDRTPAIGIVIFMKLPHISPKALLIISTGLVIVITPWMILTLLPFSPFIHVGESVVYVTFISHIAILYAALSTIQAAQVEIKQDSIEEERQKEHSADFDEIERKIDEIHRTIDAE